jgi:hypothetical protein
MITFEGVIVIGFNVLDGTVAVSGSRDVVKVSIDVLFMASSQPGQEYVVNGRLLGDLLISGVTVIVNVTRRNVSV